MSEQYFTPEQSEILSRRFDEVEAEWQEIIAKEKLLLPISIDEASKEAEL